MTSDWAGNTELNLESLERVIPPECLIYLIAYSSDNASDALKEGRETLNAICERVKELGHQDKTTIHGVPIRGISIRDPFHIYQLCVKWFSESVCGKTEKGNHDQVHHHQVRIIKWLICKSHFHFLQLTYLFLHSAHPSLVGHQQPHASTVQQYHKKDPWRSRQNVDAKANERVEPALGLEW